MIVASLSKRILIATLAFVVSVAFFFLTARHQTIAVFLDQTSESVGGNEDPYARIRFDWLKYHDPATGEIPRDIRERELAVASRIPAVESEFIRLGKTSSVQRTLTTSWARRGPFNVGGRTRAFAMDVNDTTVLLAGGVSGGMWRSSDGGASWNPTTLVGELHSATCIVQDKRPGKNSIWFYGTGELYGNSASMGSAPFRGDGLFKSTDNGLSWSRLMSTATLAPQVFNPPWDYVWNIAIDNSKIDSDIVYAATIGAIMRSNDGGTSWRLMKGTLTDPNAHPGGPFGPRLTDVITTSAGTVYASLSSLNIQVEQGVPAVDRGIWRSPDGNSWMNITPIGWASGDYKRIVFAAAPSDPSIVYVLAETPGTNPTGHSLWKYIYLSGDGSGAGGSWQDLSANLPNDAGSTGMFDSQGSYDLVIGVKPDNSQVVFLGGTNLYRSTDGWATNTNWKRIGGYAAPGSFSQWFNHHCDEHVIAFNPKNPSILLNGNDGGVFRTYNDLEEPVHWVPLNNGYFTTQFYTVAVDHGRPGNLNVIGGMQDNGTWFTNNSAVNVGWISEFSGDGAACAIADGGSSYFVSSQEGNIYRFWLDDNGSPSGIFNYTKVTPKGAGPFLFVNPFSLDPNNQNIMYLPAGDVLWRNHDLNGIPLFNSSTTSINWDSLSTTRVFGVMYTAVTAAKVPANRVFIGTSGGRIYRLDNANTGSPASIDVSTGKGMPVAYVNCIAVDPTDGDKVMVVFTNYGVQSLFYTPNAGKTWNPVGGNLEENPSTGLGGGPSTRWAAILPPGGRTTYFVGTSAGLFSTSNLNGTSTVWTQEGASVIGNLPIDMIDLRISDGYLAVATHGGGIFSTNITFQVQVYPGDANNDGLVDVRDVLPIGRFYGMIGPARTGATTIWGAQTLANPWSPLDAGFADCDGNGVIDSNDVVPIVQNWMASRAQGVPPGSDYSSAAEEILRSLDAQPSTGVTNSMRNAVMQFVNGGANTPRLFALYQNYPNPFNPSTSIRFSIPQGTSTATLTVFDIEGRSVWRQTMSELSPGAHSSSWNGKTLDGSNAASGVYIYRLIAGSSSISKRMILLR